MNKSLIFLIISTSILILSAVVICVSPIINNIEVGNWRPANWKNLNCKIISDKEKSEGVSLDDIQKYRRYKNICYRQKAMYGLEYSAFIINIILTFVCADLTLLHYLNIGKEFEKKTGLIGFISGIIGFILTLVYVCFSGYIFTNDAAYGVINGLSFSSPSDLIKLYPNGAKYKWEGPDVDNGKYITVSENDKGEYANTLLYKDLGEKQYNYNSDYYETYMKNEPKYSTPITFKNCHINALFTPTINQKEHYTGATEEIYCDYLYYDAVPSIVNRYIYDRWLTALILSVVIVICNIGLIIFGFLLFKSSEESSPSSDQTPIVYKK